MDLTEGRDVGELQVGDALLKPLDEAIDALAGRIVAPAEFALS